MATFRFKKQNVEYDLWCFDSTVEKVYRKWYMAGTWRSLTKARAIGRRYCGTVRGRSFRVVKVTHARELVPD